MEKNGAGEEIWTLESTKEQDLFRIHESVHAGLKFRRTSVHLRIWLPNRYGFQALLPRLNRRIKLISL